MTQTHKINGKIYVTNGEKSTQHEEWAYCNFTGSISKIRNGQLNYKVILTNNADLTTVQQLTDQEVEIIESGVEFEVKSFKMVHLVKQLCQKN